MAGRHSLRASDRDREEVVERLRAAAAEGRLLVSELEQRLEVALRARTYGELDPLVDDLPSASTDLSPKSPSSAARRRPGMPLVAGATLVLGLLLTTAAGVAMSGLARLGSLVPRDGTVFARGNPDGFTHPGSVGALAVSAWLVMIVFLLATCVALGWLFSQDSATDRSDVRPSSLQSRDMI